MSPIDWLFPAIAVVPLLLVCWKASTLTRSVSDFLAANRMAGRYLLCIGQGVTGLGAISIAANFEQYYQAGFAADWWSKIVAPVILIISLSGFVIYRYRQTRAMTMAQFFEMRYSRKFRIFAGMIAWASGILNYGIFPAVAARFIIHFTGLPQHVGVLGCEVPMLGIVMAVLLTLAIVTVVFGGQIAIMITDMFQGQFINIVMLLVLLVLFWHVPWSDVLEGLRHAPEGESRINPFKQQNVSDFNVWFFIMMAALQVYSYNAWQGTQGYNAAARTPHEARMAGILAGFRGMITTLVMMLVPIIIFAYLHLDKFAAETALIHAKLGGIADPQLQKQMLVPLALGQILPVGVMGLFTAMLMLSTVSTDNTYLHSWGSIFIQDVVMPLRKNKKPISPKAHMWLLRGSIVSVSVFAFVWGQIFPLNEYIFMYFQITGAIYMGGAGAVILGGLYWKRGTTAGAWTAMITGAVLAIAGILLRNIIWPKLLPGWKDAVPDFWLWQHLPEAFPLNGMQTSFLTAVIAVLSYVVVSLLSRTPPADMDKLLHRGKHAVAADDPRAAATTPSPAAQGAAVHAAGADETDEKNLPPQRAKAQASRFWRTLGVGPEFTKGDKFIYLFKLCWALFFLGVFIAGTAINFFWEIPDGIWEKWWGFMVFVTLSVAMITIVWFLWGGFHDMWQMIGRLKGGMRDNSDDGSVSIKERAQLTRREMEENRQGDAL